MCSYTYSWYYCNHDYYIWANSIEICHNRLLSGYSYDAWSIDMCKNTTVECGGFSNYTTATSAAKTSALSSN
ncbi:uncharacterized protein N0V89_002453 [Didymosphaeria variabile]|uniref:Uncharacterized protein n=1 Tax=Didymosphaeria variabile TaxID=1932322 RepID=A0A9W9CDM0_9PLEO|nr:uncharacterized protein N0V89_002453 [Didymosphaeria variabile]KAJ4357876.1 hypothetical protein N0V89_002453 [Didymosphaeria variabile]